MAVHQWSRAYCRFLTHHRLMVTLVTVVLTLVGAVWAQRVSFSSRITDYYPSQHPYVRLYQEFPEMLKMTNTVVVTVTAKDGTIYNSAILGKIHRITVGLLETKGVNPHAVMSLTHSRLNDIKVREGIINIVPVVNNPGQPQTPEALTRIKNAVYTNLGIRGVYVSPDNKTALIRAGFWDGIIEPHAVLNRLRTLAERERDTNTEVAFAGNLVLAGWLIEAAPRFLLLLFVSGGLALFLAGQTGGFLSGTVGVFLVNLVGATWGFGAIGALGLTFEPLALLVLFPLCARGICLVMSWRARFTREYQAVSAPFAVQTSQEQALERTATALWGPFTLALCIDGAALLVLAGFSDVPAIRTLGYLSGGWIAGLVLSLWTLLPLWSSVIRLPSNPGWGERFTARMAARLRSTLRPTVVTHTAMVGVSVLGLVAAVQLEAGRAMLGTTLFYPTHPYNRAFELINEKFIGTNQLIIIAQTDDKSGFRELSALQTLEAFQQHMAADAQFGGAVAIPGFIKSITRMFHEDIPKWEMLPDDINSTGQIIFRIIAGATTPSEVERFLSTDFRTTAVTLFYQDYSPPLMVRVLARVQEFIDTQNDAGVTLRLGGGLLGVVSAIHAAVEQSYWVLLGVLILLTAVAGALGSRSGRATFGVVVTLVLSQAVILALLWFGNIDLNIYTLPVVVVSAGTSLLPAFFSWAQGDGADLPAQALTATALIVAVAAAAWLFSPLRLQAEMGVLLMVFALVNVISPLWVRRTLSREPNV